MAGSNLTLLSSYKTDHSGPSSRLWQAAFPSMRSIAFVLYALRPCFSHLMYFLLQESSCILLTIKCQFFKFLGLFYMFIIPPQVPQSFMDLGLQYSPLPFLPVTFLEPNSTLHFKLIVCLCF